LQKVTKKTQKFAKTVRKPSKKCKKTQKKEPQINTDFTATKTRGHEKEL